VREYDLVIVGASFAGLACARTAAMRGLRVAVLERKTDPGDGVRTTGILVKEAIEETDIPVALTRMIREVRLHAPNGRSVDFSSPGYFFLATDTPGLLRWMAREAARAGADLLLGRAFRSALDTGAFVEIADHGIKCRLLVGADGAGSAVARYFSLGRNTSFLCGIEHEFAPEPGLDERFLHCFLTSSLAPGYIGWVVPGVGIMQVGLAASGGVRPDIAGFIEMLRKRLGLRLEHSLARRSGLIPSGATLRRTHAGRVMLIGDAAGHVSPLTGGGLVQTLRLGRRSAQLAADWIFAGGDHPAVALRAETPRFRGKLLMRRVLNLAPPDWVWNAAIGTWAFRSLAQATYFHQRRLGFHGAPPLAAEAQAADPQGETQRRAGGGP
jgi:flavin-dependent dehydrogenase